MKKRRSPFSAWGWAGVVLLIIGITLLLLSWLLSPQYLQPMGSICSIVALIWIFADNRINGMREETRGMREEMSGMREEVGGMRQEMGGMRQEMGGMREEMRGMREEMREGFESLPRRIAEELRDVLGR